MEQCCLTDLGNINEAVEEYIGRDCFSWVRSTILLPDHYWFQLDGLYVHVEMIGRHKYTIHTFGSSKESLETKRKFFIEVGCWMLDNTDCTTLCIFVPEDHRALRILMKRLKEPTCYMPCGDGEGRGEFMYTFDSNDRRELCHKQSQ